MAATLLPNAKQTFLDGNGKPLAGGQVFFYIPNTSTFKSTWQDPAQTILNTNPVILDASGEAIIWGSGTYRQVVYDVNGNLIWDQITQDPNSSLTGDLTDALFVSGVDFTPGTTTQLTLPAGPGSITNTWIYFDAAYQDDTQISSLSGVTLTFNSPIPVGVGIVTVKIGTTVAIGTPGAGTITDASVAINAGIQSSKLSYRQGAANSVTRTVQSRLSDFISLLDFGAIGDDVADDTNAINYAISACNVLGKSLFIPAPKVAYRTTAAIPINSSIHIYGEGVEPYTSLSGTGTNTRGTGSWFHFDHTGKGFDIEGGAAPASISGISFENIGTLRTQPVPNGSSLFTPTVCDWDFYISNADVFMEHVCTLNAYQAIYVTNGNQGRLTANDVFGQPLFRGLWVDTSFDSCRIENFHFWPYWSEALGVNTYTLTNGVAFGSARSDTAMYDNCFCYGYNRGFLITQNANGTTTCQITNLNIDDCFNGFVIDNSASGARVEVDGFSCQGASTDISAIGGGLNAGIICFGSSCWVNINNPDFGVFGANAVNIGGTGNIVNINGGSRMYTWNNVNAGYTAINVQAGNTLYMDRRPNLAGGNGAAMFSIAGVVKCPLDWGNVTATTDSQGHITVNHSGGYAPDVVSLTMWNDVAAIFSQVTSVGSAAFTCKFFNSSGTALANTAVTFSYDLKL